MFRAYPAHPQEVHVLIVYMRSLVSSLSAGDCPVHRLRKIINILYHVQLVKQVTQMYNYAY